MYTDRSLKKEMKQFVEHNSITCNENCGNEAMNLLTEWDQLRPVSEDFFSKFSFDAWIIAMSYSGVYQLITEDLVRFIKALIGQKNSIEVCCGNGTLGRALQIPRIDRKVQEIPEAKLVFEARKAATSRMNSDIVYPSDVEHMTANQALKKYNPEWIVGAYVTAKWHKKKFPSGNMYGPEEELFVKNRNYIHCGNSVNRIHTAKPINKRPHWVIEADWLFCRSSLQSPSQMRIWMQKDIDFEDIIPNDLGFDYFKTKL